VPAVAENGTLASMVVVPATFFCRNRLDPSMYALYQLFPSVQRRTSPQLLFENALIDAVANASASVAEAPSTALNVPDPALETSPVFPEMEKAAIVLASPPQDWPSEAVPHSA
jgi:hypothetical protein